MRIYKQKVDQIELLAAFLSNLNNIKQSHIGFCGTNSDEIQQTLREDFLEENDELSFMVAINEADEIIAAMGFDVEEDTAEVWGPFQITDDYNVMNDLWKGLCKEYPHINTFDFFINEENTKQTTFVENIGAKYTGKASVLELQRKDAQPALHNRSEPFRAEDFTAFQTLHDDVFPGTYYDANTIVDRLKEGHTLKLFKTTDNQMEGYAYYEIDAEYHEGSIEYIAINPSFRGQGLGTSLLREVTTEMFSGSNIPDISLCVSHIDQAAFRIYLKAGFTEADVLNSYVYTIGKQ